MIRTAILCGILYLLPAFLHSQVLSSNKQYREDFEFFWKSIDDEYCYFNKKQTDWEKVKEIYAPLVDTVQSRGAFVGILEKALYELYDHHAGLSTNTLTSFRLVPTGTDIWAEYKDGKAVVKEVRKGSGAEAAGVLAGMEIIAINDEPVQHAIRAALPKSLRHPDDEASSFILRLLLAGNHVQQRKITVRYNGQSSVLNPDAGGLALDDIRYPSLVETKVFGTTGYIRINNCLYNNDLIPVFDSVMTAMKDTRALIIDLRETPSGGNTSVAKAILGWFISSEKFYQKHEYYYDEKSTGIKRSWEEIVSPRKGRYYDKPLVILCDHWTGSVGEGITVGFDAIKRPRTMIVGTEMARLNGAVYSYEMPNSKIHFSFPAERLFHINGRPREYYEPAMLVHMNGAQPSKDLFIEKALLYIKGVSK